MSSTSDKIIRYALSLAFGGLTMYLGYFVRRADFVPFIAAYGIFFGLYLWLVFYGKNRTEAETRWQIGLGIALRVMLLFSIPNLSDDFYRFLWDGHLTVAGIHPFAHPPVYFIENQILPKGVTPELYGKLNSPEYFTVYPPVCQAVFALAAWFGTGSAGAEVFVIKLFLLACEVGTIWLLSPPRPPEGGEVVAPLALVKKAESGAAFPPLRGLGGDVYALNPLVIFEITGNCHFEGAMIFFLLAGLRALERNKLKRAALWWALATASKLLPLMFLPIVWRWLGWRKGLVFSAVFAAVCLILFAPLLTVLPNILSSLDLYFRQFQFNASVYYLLRGIGFWIKGYDTGESLGPFLGGATVIGVLIIAWKTKPSRFSKSGRIGFSLAGALLFALMLQLSLSATVHPWYAAVPFALGLLTGWRFPVIWSGVVALSYSHYAGGAFQENYGLIALEYVVLWIFMLREFSQSPIHSFPLSPTK